MELIALVAILIVLGAIAQTLGKDTRPADPSCTSRNW